MLFLFSAVICLSFRTSFHPFFLSSTEVNISSKEKTIKVSCRIFTDDLQQALYKEKHKPVELLKINVANKLLVAEYVKSHFSIGIGKQKVELNCLGYEIEEEAVWVYLEAPLKDLSKTIVIKNDIFCESIEGQTNLVHCIYDGERQSNKLICPDKDSNFTFPKP